MLDMIGNFFQNFLQPEVAETVLEYIVYSVIAVFLALMAKYVVAWFISLFRDPFYGKNKIWETEEVIYDTKAWAGLIVSLLWVSVIGYCVFIPTYEHVFALIPYGIALLVTLVLTALNLRRLSRPVKKYRKIARR